MTGNIVTTGVGDFSDVAAQLRERIKSAFVDLIPKERWDEMLKSEVEKFMNPRVEVDRYNHTKKEFPSEFSRICQEVMAEIVAEEVKRRFKEFSREQIVGAIREWLDANSQRMLREFVEQMFKAGVANASASLTSWLDFRIRDFVNGNGR